MNGLSLLAAIELQSQKLMKDGLPGFIDVHLPAAVALGGNMRLWTRNQHLRNIGTELNLAWLIVRQDLKKPLRGFFQHSFNGH